MIGDFNDLMYVHKKQEGRVHLRALLEGFKEVIDGCKLSDLRFIKSEFT